MKRRFRHLRPDEIEVRVAKSTSVNGKQKNLLLLYKEQRTDRRILDETFGNNWTCHFEEHKGVIYCSVGIKDPDTGSWITRENAGAEKGIEKEKSEASDAFKRACFQWGLGSELYNAPTIWADDSKEYKVTTFECEPETDNITKLRIVNADGVPVFTLGENLNDTEVQNAPSAVSNCDYPESNNGGGHTLKDLKCFIRKEWEIAPKGDRSLLEVKRSLLKAVYNDSRTEKGQHKLTQYGVRRYWQFAVDDYNQGKRYLKQIGIDQKGNPNWVLEYYTPFGRQEPIDENKRL